MYGAELTVAKFHEAFDIPIRGSWVKPERRRLRAMLMHEEFNEYMDAENDDDLVEVADGLADIIVIALGTALEYGIPLAEIFDEVMWSNMAKLGPDHRPIVLPSGKIGKPEGWKPPDVAGILAKYNEYGAIV
jgi:predicted HAD superfamily Cof-like phosphohydrolase